MDALTELLDGLLLGDGGVYVQKHGANPYFRMAQARPRMEWCNEISDELNQLGLFATARDQKAQTTIADTMLIIGRGSRVVRSTCAPRLWPIRDKWYPQGIKLVPRSLQLTPRSAALWYAGDGSHNKRGLIRIHTEGFTFDDVARLIAKLKAHLGVRATLGFRRRFYKGVWREQPQIQILMLDEAYKFIELTKPWIPPCCAYKTLHARKCPPPTCGSGFRRSKLNEVAIRVIRADENSTTMELARRYAVSSSLISQVRRGLIWRHVT